MAWRNPFRRRTKQDPAALVAAMVSATNHYEIDHGRRQDRRVSEAWDIWRCVGEVHYVVGQQARMVGRVGWSMSINGTELDDDRAAEVLTSAFGSHAVRRDLAVNAAIHLQVAGGYHLAKTGERWEILNNPAEGGTKKKLENADLVVTVENPDPHEPTARLDSPVLAALDIGRELLLTRGQARAMARSRTAQLNTVFYPQEGAPDRETFENAWIDVMTAPLADEMSTASVVPNLVAFPGDLIEKIKPLDLTGELDEKLHERIDRLVHQLATILDAPVEQLEGMGDSNHWSAWLTSEDNFLNHVEPTASPIGEGFAQALELMLGESMPGIDVEITPDPGNLLRRRPTIEHALAAAELGIVREEWVLEQLGASPEDAGPGLMAALEMRRARQSTATIDTGASGEPSAVAAAAAEPDPLARMLASLNSRPIPDLPAITAATPDPEPVDTAALAELDVEFGTQMSDLVSDAADRALERLGARLRSIAQGGKIDLPDVPNQQVAIAYTQAIPNEQATVEDTADRFTRQFDRFVTRAFEKVNAAGVDVSPDPDNTADAFGVFRTEVAKVVTARREGKTGDSEAWMASMRVNAILGGNGDPETRPVVSATGTPAPVAGIALGSRSLSAIATQYGVEPGRWIWHHAYVGPDPHPKHQSFEGRDITKGFILEDQTNWFPGDHAGSVAADTVVEGPLPVGAALRHYDGPMVKLSTSTGKNLTITPDHPVLTDRGWVNAGNLVEGDNLVGSSLDQGASRLIPDVHQRPSTAHDLFGSLWLSDRMSAAAVPVSAEHFDSDTPGKSNVYVVLNDRLLTDAGDTTIGEPSTQQGLSGGDVPDAELLPGGSRAYAGLQRVRSSTLSGVSVGDDGVSLLVGHSGDSDGLLLGRAAFSDASLAKDPVDDDSFDPVFLGEREDADLIFDVAARNLGGMVIDGPGVDSVMLESTADGRGSDSEDLADFAHCLTGIAQLDKLVSIKFEDGWVGHVYDFQTRGQWYISNGIIVHNCRCVRTPVLVRSNA